MFKLTFFRITIACLALVAVLAAIGCRTTAQTIHAVFVDYSAKPVCHKQVYFQLQNWQKKHQTREFPNVQGNSAASLAELDPRSDIPDLKTNYNYFPGLTRDDPDDLVVMYVNLPTRWTWHGPHPTIFTPKAWILVPIDMKTFGRREREGLGPGEFSERVEFEEFRQRLEKTLAFLKEQKRPHWEAVVQEHSEFLKRFAVTNQ